MKAQKRYLHSFHTNTTVNLMTEEISENVTEDRMRSERPFCVTYDFESETDGAVTVRDRDTMEQERIKIEDLDAYFAKKFEW